MASQNPYQTLYRSCYKMILNRETDKALKQIEIMEMGPWENQNDGLTWKRIAGHLRADLAASQGRWEEAKNLLSETRKNFGNNAILTIDEASMHYILGNWDAWRKTYDTLQDVLDSDLKLSPFTRMKSYLNLGKFLEEEARICYALQYYQNTCDMAENSEPDIFFEANLQKLRICATFGEKTEVAELYTQFLQLSQNRVTKDFKIDIEHSLMLAELCLVGPNHAWARVDKILKEDSVIPEDQALLLYDFLEECLIKSGKITEEMITACKKIPPTSKFEELIQSIVLLNQKKMSLEEISNLSSQTSWACYLRLLTLAMEIYPKMQTELKNKVHLLLSALPSNSRHLWIKRLDKYLKTSKKTVLYNPQTRNLSFEGKSIDLSRKRGMLTFVEIMSGSSHETVEAMIEKIWDAEFSPDHFHRLRMTAHRMNELLFDLTSIKKPIQVSADYVRFSSELELKRFEENHLDY